MSYLRKSVKVMETREVPNFWGLHTQKKELRFSFKKNVKHLSPLHLLRLKIYLYGRTFN